MHNLDDIDAKILHLLQQDATLKTRELSEKLNLSYTPVYERVRRLEKEGIIKKYVALVDREKVGKKLMAFCNIALASLVETSNFLFGHVAVELLHEFVAEFPLP